MKLQQLNPFGKVRRFVDTKFEKLLKVDDDIARSQELVEQGKGSPLPPGDARSSYSRKFDKDTLVKAGKDGVARFNYSGSIRANLAKTLGGAVRSLGYYTLFGVALVLAPGAIKLAALIPFIAMLTSGSKGVKDGADTVSWLARAGMNALRNPAPSTPPQANEPKAAA